MTQDPKSAPEAHRLHRDPDNVDGLQPENAADHRPAKETDERSTEGGKPYTTETEAYGDSPVRAPDDPQQRADATVPPRR